MPVTALDVGNIVREIWTTFLELDIEPLPLILPADADELGGVGSVVGLSGAWTGVVGLHTTLSMARVAASRMLLVDELDLRDEDVREVLDELVNCVGGNLQGVLPGPTQLSLPRPVVGVVSGLGGPEHCLLRVPMRSAGHVVSISLAGGPEGDECEF